MQPNSAKGRNRTDDLPGFNGMLYLAELPWQEIYLWPTRGMYSYDRRQAAAQARSYVEFVDHAEKMLGIKRGLEARVRDLKVDARALDQDWRQHNQLGGDDDWARLPRLEAQWKKLQKGFSYCFGYDPPALGKIS